MTVIICDKIRADEGDLVSEELRERAAQCIQRSVIRQWFGFLAVKYFIYRISHVYVISIDQLNPCKQSIVIVTTAK